MDRRNPLPVFGTPGDEYDRVYLEDLSRKLNFLTSLLRTPGEGRQTSLVLTEMPSSDYGLEAGTLFQLNGAVYISAVDKSYLVGISASGHVGSVTVNIV